MKRKMTGSIFKCTRCSHSGTKGHMLEHFTRYHVSTDRAPWSCSLCGYRSISRQVLAGHNRHYMHIAAEKKHPGAPITFVKSSNPYIVRIGQDIRVYNGPAEWESNGEESDSEDFSPGKKRRQDDNKENRKKMRVNHYLGSRKNELDIGRQHNLDDERARPSRFEDYEIDERPDMPVYDLPGVDELGEHDYCNEEGNYEQFPIFSTGRYRETFSGSDSGHYRETFSGSDRDMEMSKRLCSDHDSQFQHDGRFGDGIFGDMVPGGLGDGNRSDSTNDRVWVEWPTEPVDNHYDIFNAQNREQRTLQRQMILNSALSDHTSAFSGSEPVDFPRLCNRGQQFPSCHQSGRSGYSVTSQPHAFDSGSSDRIVNRHGLPLLLNRERVPVSSSTPEKLGMSCIDMLESSSHGHDNTPTDTPKDTEPDQPTATSVHSVGKIRRLSRHGSADQSAEVGSTCREKDKSEVAQDPENNSILPKQQVRERTASGEVNNLPKELEHPEPQTSTNGEHQEKEDFPQDESEAEGEDDSQLLEEKMTELISALEPLKNISKALIALDHHMRRLLPIVEHLTKDLPLMKTQKDQ